MKKIMRYFLPYWLILWCGRKDSIFNQPYEKKGYISIWNDNRQRRYLFKIIKKSNYSYGWIVKRGWIPRYYKNIITKTDK